MMTGDNGEASPDYIPDIRTSCFFESSSIPYFIIVLIISLFF